MLGPFHMDIVKPHEDEASEHEIYREPGTEMANYRASVQMHFLFLEIEFLSDN